MIGTLRQKFNVPVPGEHGTPRQQPQKIGDHDHVGAQALEFSHDAKWREFEMGVCFRLANLQCFGCLPFYNSLFFEILAYLNIELYASNVFLSIRFSRQPGEGLNA